MALVKSAKAFAMQKMEIDMTPMIDVTFLLLVFFMCTLQFKKFEGMLACYLPKDRGVFNVPVEKKPEEPVTIRLVKAGKKGTEIRVGTTRCKKFEELASTLEAILQRTPSIPVIIDPEIDVSFQAIISTLNVCRKLQQSPNGKGMTIKFSAKALAEK